MSDPRSIPSRTPILALALAGVILTGAMVATSRFEQGPGRQAGALEAWPARTGLMLSPDKYRLVMFVHPKCSCSEASLAQLEWLISRYGSRVQAEVLFTIPHGLATPWSKDKLWAAASQIPGVQPRLDLDGREADLFKAHTSGQTYVFTPSGGLAFAGGLTAARGHFGSSVGLSALADLMMHDPRASKQKTLAQVFGCELKRQGPTDGP